MNILLINHYAGSPRHGMEYRPYYLSREWVRRGHNVTILAATHSHVRITNPERKPSPYEEVIDGIRYVWFPTPDYNGNGVKRAINIFAFLFQLSKHAAWIRKIAQPDVVITSSTYPLDAVVGKRLAKESGAGLIHEVHDLWPLTLIEVGGMSRSHPFVRLLQWGEDYAYRTADRVVSLLPCALQYMEQHGLEPERFHHIPNGIDMDEWQSATSALSMEHLEALRRLREEKKFLVAYAGAHGIANALDNVLKAAALLRDEQIGFVLVGDGPEKPALQAEAKALGLTNLIFLDPVRKASIPALLQEMDALFIGLAPQPIFRLGISPNKLMDYMMAGKPIVLAIDAGNDPVAEADCGFSVPPGDPKVLAEAVQRLASCSPSELEAMGARGRSYVRANHDYRALADNFLDLMQSVLSKKSAPELAGQPKR